MQFFSAEEQRMILRREKRLFQTSKCQNEIRNAVFYKSAFGQKKSRRASLPDGLFVEKTTTFRQFRATRLKCAMDVID